MKTGRHEPNIFVVDGGGGADRAARVAKWVGCEVADCEVLVCDGDASVLVVTPERLELRYAGATGEGGVFVDFVSRRSRHRGVSVRQPLARAIGVGRGERTVVDATAGLGGDAFVLATLGCTVTAIERSRIVAALLEDGLTRAHSVPALEDLVANRIRLVAGDAIKWLQSVEEADRPDVVYLDPMYASETMRPERMRKEMRALRRIVGDDGDARVLLEAARRVARERVVVKRMRHAPSLGETPSVVYRGSVVRYDAYLTTT